MGLIRMDKIHVTDKIHIDDLELLDMVNIDVLITKGRGNREGKNDTKWNTIQKPNDQGFIDRHNMYVDISYFEKKIIDSVERNHPLDVERIIKNWDFPSYNLLKGFNTNGIGGDKRCNYSVNIDKDGFVKSIVIMTERNCRYVLDWVLKLV
jgi:hypothetical protein